MDQKMEGVVVKCSSVWLKLVFVFYWVGLDLGCLFLPLSIPGSCLCYCLDNFQLTFLQQELPAHLMLLYLEG